MDSGTLKLGLMAVLATITGVLLGEARMAFIEDVVSNEQFLNKFQHVDFQQHEIKTIHFCDLRYWFC